jgi:hypothetical protein
VKNGKRPTLRQKRAIAATGRDPEEWRVIKVLTGKLEIVHKSDGSNKDIISA